MSAYIFMKKYGFGLLFILFLGLNFSANAQTSLDSKSITLASNPNFDYIISWRSLSYVPAEYKGKIMASDNATIEISFDAVNQGKIVDLLKQTVEWRLNNNLITSGIGLKSIKFAADQNTDQVITITVPNYSDSRYKMAELNAATTITLIPPELVIKAPYPNKQTTVGEKLFQALPYFFNISDIKQLSINWEVNGSKTANQSDRSDLFSVALATQGEVAQGASVGIKAFAQNITNQFEFAQNYINLNLR